MTLQASAERSRPAPGLGFLLRPRLQAALNAWSRANRTRRLVWAGFLAMTLIFWLGVLWVCVYFIEMFDSVELFGPLLVRKALSMLLLSFSGLLFFSNMVAALSSFFLADDMQLLQSLPIGPRLSLIHI